MCLCRVSTFLRYTTLKLKCVFNLIINVTLLQCVLNNGCYIIGGDFNCCTFQNNVNNRVYNLLNDLQAKPALLCYKSPMEYTFMHETNNFHSFIDDIVYNCGHMNVLCMKSVDIIDDLENFSDHCVAQCIFAVMGKVETFVDDECNDQFTCLE